VAKEQAELLVQWVEGGVAGRGRASAGEEEAEGAEEEPREELAQEAELEATGLGQGWDEVFRVRGADGLARGLRRPATTFSGRKP
jgi:hypothetical protein